jgi:EmrB/QacA subfamily drug resistance transporter
MTRKQRTVLLISILASFVAFLDGSVINVALPAMAAELGGGLILQQWVVDAYLITLGALMLIAGSLSDLFGRKRILVTGLIGFGITSLLCAVAPTGEFLVISRALQGCTGALLVPSSLALIISSFSGPAQGKAIGSWTAWTGMAFLVGPLLGGLLVDSGSWRFIFAINVLPIIVTMWLLMKIKEPAAKQKRAKVDSVGALLAAIGLGGPVFALIEQGRYGWSSPLILLPLAAGVAALAIFIWYERRTPAPMLPLSLFSVRNFSVGNIATTAIYAGLSIATFLIAVFVQQVGGYSAIEAGLALIPVTLIMFFLSGRFGALAGIYGPRLFMAAGPMIAAAGFAIMVFVDSSVNYWALLPGILLLGLGLSITVAPLTSAILGAVSSNQAGIASAVNNAIARIAGLLAIALLGLVTGPEITLEGFQRGAVLTAALLVVGGVISAAGIKNPSKD